MATIPTFQTFSAGSVLTAAQMNSNVRDGGTFFLTQPIAWLRQTSAQTLSTSTTTAITFDTEDFDTDGGHSTSSNTSRYTAQTAGYWLFVGGIGYAGNATGRRFTWWRKNGSDQNASDSSIGAAGANIVNVAARAFLVSLNGSTDYIELAGWQDSGGNLNTAVSGIDQPSMGVFWLRTN